MQQTFALNRSQKNQLFLSRLAWILYFLWPAIMQAQSLDDLYTKFALAYSDKDANALAELYADQGSLINLYHHQPPTSFEGRKNIFDFFSKAMEEAQQMNKKLSIAFKIIDRSWHDSKASDNGFYHVKVEAADGTVKDRFGKLSAIIGQQDGDWKFFLDVNATATKSEFVEAAPIAASSQSNDYLSAAHSIQQINKKYLSAWLQGDDAGVMDLFASDAEITPSGMKPISGHEDIRQFWFPDTGLTFMIDTFEADELSLHVEDTIAFATQEVFLHFHYHQDAHLINRSHRSIDTTIYRRKPKGNWKIWKKAWVDFEVKIQ